LLSPLVQGGRFLLITEGDPSRRFCENIMDRNLTASTAIATTTATQLSRLRRSVGHKVSRKSR